MTQTLRRERKQKFYTLLVEIGAVMSGWSISVKEMDLKEWRMDLAGQLADAATSATERRTDEVWGEYDARPNIFKIYEQNIGQLTPLISDELRDIEKDTPDGWFEEAVKESLRMNVRNLKYIKSILARWKTSGRDTGHKKQEEQPKQEAKSFPKFVNGKAVFDA